MSLLNVNNGLLIHDSNIKHTENSHVNPSPNKYPHRGTNRYDEEDLLNSTDSEALLRVFVFEPLRAQFSSSVSTQLLYQ